MIITKTCHSHRNHSGFSGIYFYLSPKKSCHKPCTPINISKFVIWNPYVIQNIFLSIFPLRMHSHNNNNQHRQWKILEFQEMQRRMNDSIGTSLRHWSWKQVLEMNPNFMLSHIWLFTKSLATNWANMKLIFCVRSIVIICMSSQWCLIRADTTKKMTDSISSNSHVNVILHPGHCLHVKTKTY